MTRRAWVVVGALTLLLAVWLARRPSQGTPEGAAPDVEATAPREQTEGGRVPAPGTSARHALDERRRGFELGRRLLLPRPPGSEAPPAPAPRHPKALAPGYGTFVDRRPNPGPDSARVTDELHSRMAEVRAAAARCLDGWAQADPSLEGGVMLAFSIDDRGLKEVWIMDHDEAPSGPLACLSNAVYPVDWSGLTKDPMRVTVRVGYAQDGGAAGGAPGANDGGAPT
jgi:hypothetical protein